MSGPYDRERLVALFGDDHHTLAEVEHDFLETVRIAEREIAGTDDLAVVARVAHRLKGASGMIGAVALCDLAGGIEKAAKEADRPGLKRLHGALSEEACRFAEQTAVGCV